MEYWDIERRDGIFIAEYCNPPTNYLVAPATIELNELNRSSAVWLTAAKRSINRGANLPIEEGLKVEAEEWLKTIVTDEAMALMRDYVAQPFEQRHQWLRRHGVPPAPGQATGS